MMENRIDLPSRSQVRLLSSSVPPLLVWSPAIRPPLQGNGTYLGPSSHLVPCMKGGTALSERVVRHRSCPRRQAHKPARSESRLHLGLKSANYAFNSLSKCHSPYMAAEF